MNFYRKTNYQHKGDIRLNKKLLEGLTKIGQFLAIADVPEHICTINDAMEEIRSLEGELKTERDKSKELEQKIIRQNVRKYNQ